jgi:hypothetical protein
MKRQTGSARKPLFVSFPLLGVGLLSVVVFSLWLLPASAQGAAAARVLTLYSVATAEQYVNNADDRARGKGNNPFGNFRDASATVTHVGGAPFPGDEALFKFSLFADASLDRSAGSAIFTCQYNFNKNAYCDAVYQLATGTLFAAGAFNYDANSFALAITGGSGPYFGSTGGIQVSPGPKHSQRLALTLG